MALLRRGLSADRAKRASSDASAACLRHAVAVEAEKAALS
jgi:hypothetical protein